MSGAKQYRESSIYFGGGIHQVGDVGGRYWLGAVATKDGFVHVYAEDRYAGFTFIHDGRQFGLVIRRAITKRGLVTIARRFAADVVNGDVP